MGISTARDKDVLEGLMDKLGLQELLNLASAICIGKSDNSKQSYGDGFLHKKWNQAGLVLSTVADLIPEEL